MKFLAKIHHPQRRDFLTFNQKGCEIGFQNANKKIYNILTSLKFVLQWPKKLLFRNLRYKNSIYVVF